MTLFKDAFPWGIGMFLDLSTFCNAGCPQCDRTNFLLPGLGKYPWIDNVMWNLERVKKAYPPSMLFKQAGVKGIKKATLCGTWGDPMMVKDIDKISYYFLEEDTELTINTNAGMREPMWWYTYGRRLSEYDAFSKVTFDIDGINNEMHAKYRRKTELDKVLANMEAFTLGGGIARAHTIVFQHNENYLNEIRDLAMKHGAREVDFQKSNRDFPYMGEDGSQEFRFLDEDGNPDVLRKSKIDLSKALTP